MGSRTGRTTGACAAAAASAALTAWQGKEPLAEVSVPLPNGGVLPVPILWSKREDDAAVAAVIKDAGDDPDVTNGLTIIVKIEPGSGQLEFIAGEGVGTVTKPGLRIPPGEPAINPGPRQMIAAALAGSGSWRVTVSIPGGSAVAEKTYNPRLGIMGGLSILGNSGVVRPHCRKAMIDSFACALSVAKAAGHEMMALVPGHIGARAVEKTFIFSPEQLLEVGNDWGPALAMAREAGFSSVLVAGHPGKLVKLAQGAADTHSAAGYSALPLLKRWASELNIHPSPEAQTAEGFLMSLSDTARHDLATRAATEIRRAVSEKWEVDNAVWLCTMDGDELGKCGDVSPWLKNR